jgi:hypothetical protein
MKWIRVLVPSLASVLTISLFLPAKAQAAETAKARKDAPTRILRLEELKVEGRIQKPQAMFLMPRANLNIGELDRSEPLLPKISQAVLKAPF